MGRAFGRLVALLVLALYSVGKDVRAAVAWENGLAPDGNALGARKLLAPGPSPVINATGSVQVVNQNSTQATADFLGALQAAMEKVTVTASNSLGLFAQCTCESDLSGLQAQLLVALGALGSSSSLGNGTSGSLSGQISVSQLPEGQLTAATSSSAAATAVGQNGAAIQLDADSATAAVSNSSTVGGFGTDTRGAATASDKEKESALATSDSVQSGGSSRIAQTNNANVSSYNIPADALRTPYQTVVVSTSVTIQYTATGLVTADVVTVSVHTEATASSRIDLIFPDPQTSGRVYLASIVAEAGSECECSANSSIPNGGGASTPLAQGSASNAQTVSAGFATDPLACNIYGSRPNLCFSADGSNSICCPGSCPSSPGSVAMCADIIVPAPTTTPGPSQGLTPPDSPTGGANPPATGSSDCSDSRFPNGCYNAPGNAFVCCPGGCPQAPDDTPRCDAASGAQPTGSPQPTNPTSPAATEPAATSAAAGPSSAGTCGAPTPNPCYNAAGNEHTCCADACGSPPGDTPFCATGVAAPEPTPSSTTQNSGPTATTASMVGGSSPAPTLSGNAGAMCGDPVRPNPCYNAAGNAHTCCADACGSPPGDTPFCETGSAAPEPTPVATTPTPGPTATTPNSTVGSPMSAPTPSGCPGQGPGNAAACGQISQNSSTTGNGCTDAVATLNAKAQGQTVELYANQLADQLDSAFAQFCERPTATQLAVSAGMVAEELAIATATALLDATTTVCTCGGTDSFAVASISGYVSAVATAMTDTTAQALTAIFGSGNCENGALLSQSVGFAQSAASDIVTATNSYYNLLNAAQASDPVTPGGQSKAIACQSSAVGARNRLVQLYADAYSCAIVTVFSSAYNDADPYVFSGQTTPDQAGVCANQVSIAFSDPVYGPAQTCSTSCQCQFGLSFAPNPADNGQTQTCQCPSGKTFHPETPGCQ